jgi:rod shape determining protein RodA
MFDRKFVQYFDWGLLGLAIVLGGLGLTTLYSVVTADPMTLGKTLYFKQMTWFCGGLVLMVITCSFNYKLLDRYAFAVYIVCLATLVAVLLFGKYAGGSKRWLVLGPVSVQPSEMAKLAIIIVLARYYSKNAYTRGFTLRDLFIPAVLVLVPAFLIIKQPDLGTALLLAIIAGSMTLFVKIEKRSLLALIFAGTLAVPMVWFVLKDYQKQRILTFLNPDRDPLGAGYHIIQSKIAIGSGMLVGKGYLKGTQNALSFLPEQHTDFIFSVFAEEWGFVGCAILVLVFLLLIVWGLNVAYSCRDPFGNILAVGISAMIFWQVFVNIGMVMGLMPVVGVPLPFISYGGSSIATMMVSIGLLINVSMRRFTLE